MTRKTFSLTALSEMVGRNRNDLRRILHQLGIPLRHTPRHYADERPRKTTVRHYQPLTASEAQRVIEYVRALAGAKAAARARKGA